MASLNFLFGYSQRIESLLENNWKFVKGEVSGAQSVTIDDTDWESVTVPHDWAIYGPFDRNNDLQNVTIVQNLEEKSVNIYAILINLGANTVDDVALTDLKIKDGEIFLKGRAKNYQNIAVYKEKLSEIRFFQTSEIGEIKINTEDNLLDFTMKIVMR